MTRLNNWLSRVFCPGLVCILLLNPGGAFGEPQTPSSAVQSESKLEAPDIPKMIEVWKSRRDSALELWKQNQGVLPDSGRPGPLAALIHRDRGVQRAAERIIADLEKLRGTARSEAEQRAGLAKLRDEWQQAYKDSQEIWRVNKQMLPGGGRPGLNAATANSEGGFMEAIEWARSDLEPVLGKPPAAPLPPEQVMAQAVIDRLPKGILTVAQLNRFLEKNKSPELTDQVITEVRRRFEEVRESRIDRLQTLSDLLEKSPVVLTSRPSSPVPWNPADKDSTVSFATDEEGIQSTLGAMRALLRQLTGTTPQVKVWYVWKGTDGKVLGEGPTYDSRISVPIKELKPLSVSVTRYVRVEAGPLEEDEETASILVVSQRVHSNEGSLKVDVKPLEFPTEIAGRWTGFLVITDIPVLANFQEDGTLAPRKGNDPTDPFAEGCSLSPEAVRQMRQRLNDLKGKQIALSWDLQPASVFGGQAVFTTKSPDGTPGSKEPLRLPYKSSGGVISIEGTKDNQTVVMEGNFEPVAQGWRIRGTFSVFGYEKGKKIHLLTGTWTGTNPNAK